MKILAYNARADEEAFFAEFSKTYQVEVVRSSASPEAGTAELARGYQCISVVTRKIDAALMQQFYDVGVRFISTRTVGYDHIDVDAARRLGIEVDNISYSTGSVAEYTVMMILMLNRKMKMIMERTGVQDNSLPFLRGRELHTMTVGVIGTGNIGCRVIETLRGFGCRVIAYNRREIEAVKPYCEYVPLEVLYRESDLITLHIPATKENQRFINEESIHQMKEGVCIVNTSRGELIDSMALIRGIEERKIGGAALDVIDDEQGHIYRDMKGVPLKNRVYAILKSFPNVIITPHTAFYTDQAISDMVENSIKSCVAFMEKGAS